MSSLDPRRKKTGHGALKRRKTRSEAARRNIPQSPVSHQVQGKKQSTVILEGLKKASSLKRGKELKRQGMSLGVKFALVISLVAVSMCCFASFVVYFQTKKALLAEIDRKGATGVKAVGSIARAYYQRHSNLEQQLANTTEKAQKKEIEKKQWQTVMDFTAALGTIVAYGIEGNNGKSEQLFSEEILNVCIYSNEVPDIQAGKCNIRNLANTGDYATYTEVISNETIATNIEVADGQLSDKSRSYRVKVYRVQVFPEQQQKLEAYVCISKKDIEHTTGTVMFAIFAITLVAVVVSVFISILLARHVTQPLRFLIEDVERVSGGDLKHTTVVSSKDEIGILAHTFNIMTKNLRIAHQAELERQAREYEMQIAIDIQSHLLPSQIPKLPGYEISAFYHPSKEVGGDYYDFIEIDSDHMGFIVADVSGKSIPGSMVMTMARALIRMQAFCTLSPAKMFAEVNKVLSQDIRKGMFVTAMYGVLEISSGKLTLSSAGHNPAVIWRAANKQNELANPAGMALGLVGNNTFNKTIKEQIYQVNPGDSILLYTDGVPEAMDPANEEFGDDRFYDLVAKRGGKSCNQLVNVLVQTLEEWRKDCVQSDDITIVAFRRESEKFSL